MSYANNIQNACQIDYQNKVFMIVNMVVNIVKTMTCALLIFSVCIRFLKKGGGLTIVLLLTNQNEAPR